MTPLERADELERRFGDPRDPDNPLGFAAILAADERAEPFAAGQRVLGDFGLEAEFVPVEDGGHLAGLDGLIEIMRSVHRRDPRLALAATPTSAEPVAAAVPAMATGILDTGLRTTVRHVASRRLYGRAVIDLPYIGASLAGAFVDLLICDAFGAVAARAGQLMPASAAGYAAAAGDAVFRRLRGAMHQLSVLLGARFYIREGDHAIFQKLLRDLQAVSLGTAPPAATQARLAAVLARRGWLSAGAAPRELFRLDAGLPSLPSGPIAGDGPDHLAAALRARADQDADDPEGREVRGLARVFVTDLGKLGDELATAGPHELTRRYVRVLEAGACLGVWQAAGEDPFLGDPGWLLAALARLSPRPEPLPDDVEKRLSVELLDRHAQVRGFGLANRHFPG